MSTKGLKDKLSLANESRISPGLEGSVDVVSADLYVEIMHRDQND